MLFRPIKLNSILKTIKRDKRGKFKYQGVSVTGEMQVCTDRATKDEIRRFGDVLYYKQGVTDPDYCVLKFTGKTAEYYCDFKIETIEL